MAGKPCRDSNPDILSKMPSPFSYFFERQLRLGAVYVDSVRRLIKLIASSKCNKIITEQIELGISLSIQF
jgi:hypothetical protein